MKYLPFLMFVVLSIASCKSDDDTSAPQPVDRPNILLIISDDKGKDATAGFDEGSMKPITPHIDEIRDNGISFNNFWVNPTCSPTRSSIITGKYGYRTGVKWAGDVMSESEVVLQKYINDNTSNAYSTAVIGKWHLAGNVRNYNPENLGIDYFSGIIRGSVNDFYNWEKAENGVTTDQTQYITEAITDLSIDWINTQDKPWFLWMAHTAPHTPFHAPPTQMHTRGDLPTYTDGDDPMPYYLAAIEAMDYQIGRLLDNIPQEELDNTIIIYMCDNGTSNQVAQAPYSSMKAKGTVYQGGINVPMYISGKGVNRTGDDNNIINSVDLFSTIAEIAGVEVPEINDSKSFKSLLSSNGVSNRQYNYTEMESTNRNQWTITDGTYKLIVNANGNEELYNISSDPYENIDLLDFTLSVEASNARTDLKNELTIIRN